VEVQEVLAGIGLVSLVNYLEEAQPQNLRLM
jgi:hypothetical protein